jgi:hypothetical protein
MSKISEEFREEIGAAEKGSMDDVESDTPLVFVDKIVTSFEDDPEGEGQIRVENIIFKRFVFKKEWKQKILVKVIEAMSHEYNTPFLILMPRSMIKKKINLDDVTYPIPFLGHKIYIVPYMRYIKVYENE